MPQGTVQRGWSGILDCMRSLNRRANNKTIGAPSDLVGATEEREGDSGGGREHPKGRKRPNRPNYGLQAPRRGWRAPLLPRQRRL
eukprot:3860421-Pyramimonas_sp.AAC.2